MQQPVNPSPFPADELTPVFAAAAEHIVRTTGITRGYCLVLGCGTGRLAFELAKRTELQICGIEPDLQKAQAARRALDAAGLYGARVSVEHGDLTRVPFSDYFANLVVSEDALVSGQLPGQRPEAFRMLKPLGGTICIGQPAAAGGKVKPLSAAAAAAVAGRSGDRRRARLRGRTACGSSSVAGRCRGRAVGPINTPSRATRPAAMTNWSAARWGCCGSATPGRRRWPSGTQRAAAPLAINGRLFVLGEGSAEPGRRGREYRHGLRRLQRTPAVGTQAARDAAVQRDPRRRQLGRQRRQPVRGRRRRVPAVGCRHRRNEMHLQAATGGRWRHRGSGAMSPWSATCCTARARSRDGRPTACSRSIWPRDSCAGSTRLKDIGQGSIAIGDGRLFFAAPGVTDDQRAEALAGQVKEVHRLSDAERAALLKKLEAAAVYRVVALDAATGDKRLGEARRGHGRQRRSLLVLAGRRLPPRRAGPVRRVPRRPLLDAVPRRTVRLAAGGRLVRQGRRAAVAETDRLPRASGGDRRHAARRTVGLRPAHRRATDARSSGDRARGSLAVRPPRAPLRVPRRVAAHACSSAP